MSGYGSSWAISGQREARWPRPRRPSSPRATPPLEVATIAISMSRTARIGERAGRAGRPRRARSIPIATVSRSSTAWRNPIPAMPAAQRDLSVSYKKIGDVQVAQGDLAGALKSYRDSLAIATGWRNPIPATPAGSAISRCLTRRSATCRSRRATSPARSSPIATASRSETAWRNPIPATPAGSAISRCRYEKIGDVQVAQGDLAGALKSYRDSLAIIDRLAQSDPGNAGWQRDLSVSYEKIGDVQMAQGDLAGALDSYRDSLAIIESPGAIRSRQRRLAARSLGVLQQDRQRAGRAGRPRRRAQVLPRQPRDQRPPGEVRSRQRRLAARSRYASHTYVGTCRSPKATWPAR